MIEIDDENQNSYLSGIQKILETMAKDAHEKQQQKTEDQIIKDFLDLIGLIDFADLNTTEKDNPGDLVLVLDQTGGFDENDIPTLNKLIKRAGIENASIKVIDDKIKKTVGYALAELKNLTEFFVSAGFKYISLLMQFRKDIEELRNAAANSGYIFKDPLDGPVIEIPETISKDDFEIKEEDEVGELYMIELINRHNIYCSPIIHKSNYCIRTHNKIIEFINIIDTWQNNTHIPNNFIEEIKNEELFTTVNEDMKSFLRENNERE
jgi:hypothetical protein